MYRSGSVAVFFAVLFLYTNCHQVDSKGLLLSSKMISVAQLDPNYVVSITYSKENLSQLLTELSAKGLHAVTRPGHDASTVYVFVKDTNAVLLPTTSTLPYVQNVTPLYDSAAQKKIDELSSSLLKKKLFPSREDLIQLAHVTSNPEEALFFAFAKNYTRWLMPLSLVGLALRLFSKASPWEFNLVYFVVLLLWGVGFVTFWKYRSEPLYAKELGYVTTISGKTSNTVFLKKLCFIPIAITFTVCLLTFQFACFLLEIFITQVYQGPLSSVLSLLPTILISAYVPILTVVYNIFVNKMVAWEKSDNPVKSKVEKNFILTFLTSYVPLLITLFVYLPLGHALNFQLKTVMDFCTRFNIPVLDSPFKINVHRYQQQFFYFSVTNQVIALVLDNVLPLIMDKVMPIVKGENKPGSQTTKIRALVAKEFPQEQEYFESVRSYNVGPWGTFNVDDNLKKLVVQFGYVVMFSTIWPLAPLVCVLFNLVIYKCDIWRALKKCKPTVDFTATSNTKDVNVDAKRISISPWNSILQIIIWFASLVSPALVLMYRNCDLPGVGLATSLEKRDQWYLHSPIRYDWKKIIVFVFIAEHVIAFLYWVMSKFATPLPTFKSRDYVPAQELTEPPTVDLTSVVKETEMFMGELSGMTTEKPTPSTVAAKDTTTSYSPVVTKEDSVITSGSQTNPSYNGNAELTQRNAAKPAQKPRIAPNTAQVKQQLQGISLPMTKGPSVSGSTSSQPSYSEIHSDSSTSLTSSVAGATLPEFIPTSKNYHLRHGKEGERIKPSVENTASKIRGNAENAATVSNSKGENNINSLKPTLKDNAPTMETLTPNIITTSPSNERPVSGEQFIPSELSVTNKEEAGNSNHVPVPPVTVVTPVKKQQELNTPHAPLAVVTSTPHVTESAKKQPQRSNSVHSSKSPKAEKKKMKGVLSPLNKLKKKF